MSGLNKEVTNILKPNYKSTPVIKNNHLNLNEEIYSSKNVLKETFHSNKGFDKNIQIEIGQNNFVSPNKRLTPKSNSNNQAKNAQVNLWRKPVHVGGGTQVPINDKPVNKFNKVKAVNLNIKSHNLLLNSNLTGLTGNNTNILSTNYTENKRDDLTTEMTEKTTSPINRCINPNLNQNEKHININKAMKKKFISKTLKSDSNSKPAEKFENFENFEKYNQTNNFMTNYKSNVNVTPNTKENENFQSEILSSIMNFKTLLKSNEKENNMDKLLSSEENAFKIKELNCRLNIYGGGIVNNMFKTSHNISYDSKNLLNENNILRRDTFIEPAGKPINVINANMLGEHNFTHTNFLKKPAEKREDKMIMMNEIAVNSDMRLKRYEILLEFINSNLKEINQIMTNTNPNPQGVPSGINQHNQYNEQPNNSSYINKIEEVNSNKMSSLHSKINLNSQAIIEKEMYEFEESILNEKNILANRHFMKNQREDSNVYLNLDNIPESNLREMANKQKNEAAPSFFVSSINSDFYQHLLEESYSNINHNFINDMSSFRTQMDQTRKLERMISYESDKTPLQYMNNLHKQSSVNVVPKVSTTSTLLNKDIMEIKASIQEQVNQSNQSDTIVYYEGDENLEESDHDRTKEHIQTVDPK